MKNYSKEQNKKSSLREMIQSSVVEGFEAIDMDWDESVEYQLSIEGTEVNNLIDNILYFTTSCKNWNSEQLVGMIKFNIYSTWGDGFPADNFNYKEVVIDIISQVNIWGDKNE